MSWAIDVASTSGSAPPLNQSNVSLDVTKIAPSSVAFGDQFNVTIEISNPSVSPVFVSVYEYIANLEIIGQNTTESSVQSSSVYAAMPPLLSWNLTLAPESSQNITYLAKPIAVGMLTIGSTQVFTADNEFFSNPLLIHVNCTATSTCDRSIGETPLNCPDKCGGNASIAPADAPELTAIATPPVAPTNPSSTPQTNQATPGNQSSLILGIIVCLALIVGIAYLILNRKAKSESKKNRDK